MHTGKKKKRKNEAHYKEQYTIKKIHKPTRQWILNWGRKQTATTVHSRKNRVTKSVQPEDIRFGPNTEEWNFKWGGKWEAREPAHDLLL